MRNEQNEMSPKWKKKTVLTPKKGNAKSELSQKVAPKGKGKIKKNERRLKLTLHFANTLSVALVESKRLRCKKLFPKLGKTKETHGVATDNIDKK